MIMIMRPSRTRVQWRMVLLGAGGLAALTLAWIALPGRAPAAEQCRERALQEVHRALCDADPEALSRARELLRRGVSRDLLGQHLPAALAVVEGLRRTSPGCDPARGDPVQRGVCLLRRRRYAAAVVALSQVPAEQGGLEYREVGAQLLRLHRGHALPGRRAP
jgi:hypothetical protein